MCSRHIVEGPVGGCVVAGLGIELTHEESQAHLLRTLAAFHSPGKIGQGGGVAVAFHVEVGCREVILRQQRLFRDFVALDVCEHVVGLGNPPHSAVAAHLPQLRLGHHFGHPLEAAGGVVESGGCRGEVALHVLRLAHHEPGIVQEGIILFAHKPFLVFGVARLARVLLRLLGDAVQLYSLLHLLYCAVETAFRFRGFLYGVGFGRVDEHAACVVVLIVGLHGVELLYVVGLAVVVHVVARVEGLPEARHCSVLLSAARGKQHCHKHCCHCEDYMSAVSSQYYYLAVLWFLKVHRPSGSDECR